MKSVLYWGILFELSIGWIGFVLAVWTGCSIDQWMPTWREPNRLLVGLLGGAGLGVVLAGCILGLERLKIGWITDVSSLGEEYARKLLAHASAPEAIALCLAAGIGEELFFRGWLQLWGFEFLSERWGISAGMAATIAIGLASAAFGAMHPISRGYVFIVILLGAVIGLAFHLTQNLLLVMMAHFVYDAILILGVWRAQASHHR